MTEHQNPNTIPGHVGISSYTSPQFHAAPPESVDGEAMGVIETRNFYDPIPATALLSASKHEQSVLVSRIGQRMREARELNNLSQSAAAKRFGYANPSKLSKIEAATDTNSVPLWLIHAAARLYSVSVDFLFGLTDDWETEAPRSAQHWLIDCWQQMRERDLRAIDQLHAEVVTVAKTTSELMDGVRGIGDALSAFRTRNGEFDDMPASALLVGRLARLEAIARDAEVKLRKLRLAPKEIV